MSGCKNGEGVKDKPFAQSPNLAQTFLLLLQSTGEGWVRAGGRGVERSSLAINT